MVKKRREEEAAKFVDKQEQASTVDNASTSVYRDNSSASTAPGIHRDDLLGLYLARQGEQTSGGDNKDLTDKDLRDIILNFVIAGRDTTAQALSWSIYRLCIHPHVQQRARQEIQEVLGNDQGRGWPSYEALQKMKYIEAVCMEVLRFHPSVPKEAKFAFADDVLPDGTKVYKGDCVVFVPWVMGRTERLWPNCEEFQPERFLSGAKHSPFVFTAFQAGPRTCLGQNLAILEMKCCIARLLSHFEFKLEQDPSTVTYVNTITLPIRGALMVSVSPVSTPVV